MSTSRVSPQANAIRIDLIFAGMSTEPTYRRFRIMDLSRERGKTAQTIGDTHIRSMSLNHTWLFSDYDPMTIFFANAPFQEFECVGGTIHITGLGGKTHLHRPKEPAQVGISSLK